MSLNTRKYSDLDVSFLAHPVTGDIVKKKEEQAIVQSFKNLIFLNHYEKPFHPEIGSNVKRMLFELIDPIIAGSLEKEIRQMIENFEPRVILHQLVATPDYDNNGYAIKFIFSIDNKPEPIKINVFLERLR